MVFGVAFRMICRTAFGMTFTTALGTAGTGFGTISVAFDTFGEGVL